MPDVRRLPELRSAGGRGLEELRRRLLFLAGALVVLRFGSFVPVPGVDTRMVTDLLLRRGGGVVGVLDTFSGGALTRSSIFALGILPHISASVAVQLLSAAHPGLGELRREGERGRRQLCRYTRCATLLLAALQSVGLTTSLSRMAGRGALIDRRGFLLSAPLSLVCGTMFLTWLGEWITARGLGNGISVIVLTGILSGVPSALGEIVGRLRSGELRPEGLLLLFGLVAATALLIVFVERGQHRIVVGHTRQRQGGPPRVLRHTHLPLRINAAGVMPTIFASSTLLIVGAATSWLEDVAGRRVSPPLSAALQPGEPIYLLLHAAAVVLFCFLYTSLILDPRETADSLRRSGLFIPGIRPGEQTARHVRQSSLHLTGVGAAYICLVCLVPELIRQVLSPLRFSGTSLLIVIVVVMDLITQLQVLLLSGQYGAILRKIGPRSPAR